VPVTFRDGLARLRVENRFGFINTTGAMVIPAKYSNAQAFSENLAAVQIGGQWVGQRVKGGQWGFINPAGEMVIKPRFAFVGAFSESLAPVWRIDPKNASRRIFGGYIDRTGKVKIPANTWSRGRAFSQQLAAVQTTDGLWGFIDRNGREAIAATFPSVGDFSESAAAVLSFAGRQDEGKKWGYIDRTGKVIVPPQFDFAGPFRDGLAEVRVGDRRGYINRDGKYVWKLSE